MVSNYRNKIVNACLNADWIRITSLFRVGVFRLQELGDYPEKQGDDILYKLLINIDFYCRMLKDE